MITSVNQDGPTGYRYYFHDLRKKKIVIGKNNQNLLLSETGIRPVTEQVNKNGEAKIDN